MNPIWKHSVTVDIVIFTVENNELEVLLIKRAMPPYQGEWALPGGFLKEGEDTSSAALRILKDKAGINKIYVEQLYTFDNMKTDPRGPVMSVAYFALLPRKEILIKLNADSQEPTFHKIKSLPKLAFNHKHIYDYALKRLRAKLEYTNAIYSLLPNEFTFSQLQKTYELILNKHLDKRNFRKKFMSLKLIKPTTKMQKGARQRPAKLYTFASKKITELVKFF